MIYPDPGPEQRNWSVTFNSEVEKELDVELAHVLFHGRPIYYVNFSQDGKYLAAGCHDGKAYIYDVQTGKLVR
jgi:WD40 repeat protein